MKLRLVLLAIALTLVAAVYFASPSTTATTRHHRQHRRDPREASSPHPTATPPEDRTAGNGGGGESSSPTTSPARAPDSPFSSHAAAIGVPSPADTVSVVGGPSTAEASAISSSPTTMTADGPSSDSSGRGNDIGNGDHASSPSPSTLIEDSPVRTLQHARAFFAARMVLSMANGTSPDDTSIAAARRVITSLTPRHQATCSAPYSELERAVLVREPQQDTRIKLPWCWLPGVEDTAALPEYGRSADDSGSLCVANRSRPMIRVRSRNGKMKRKLLEQGCAAKYPANDARPHMNRSYTWVRAPRSPSSSDSSSPPPRGSTTSVALLLSGQYRRFSASGPTLNRNIVQPNKAHVYAAMWPIPEDAVDAYGSGPYAVDQLTRFFGNALMGVRVEFLGPRLTLGHARFTINSDKMYYLIEAATRLALANPRETYAFFIRARFDMAVSTPVVVVPIPASSGRARNADDDPSDGDGVNRRGTDGGGEGGSANTGESDTPSVDPSTPGGTPTEDNATGGEGQARAGNGEVHAMGGEGQFTIGGEKRNQTAPPGDGGDDDSSTEESRTAREADDDVAQLPTFGRPIKEWELRVGGRRPWRLSGRTLVMPSYTWCCMNDWFAVGPVRDAMDLYGFVYSLATMSSARTQVQLLPLGGFSDKRAKSKAVPYPGDDDVPVNETVSMGFAMPHCAVEMCLARSLALSGVPWKLAPLPVTLGADPPREDTSRGAKGCPSRCPMI